MGPGMKSIMAEKPGSKWQEWWQGQEAESSYLQLQSESKENKPGEGWSYELSKSTLVTYFL